MEHKMTDIIKIANDLKKGKINQSSINNIIINGFNDYNNDFSEQREYILSEILRNPNIIVNNKDIYSLLKVIINESDINIFFENYQHKKLTYTQKEINLLLDSPDVNEKNKDQFFDQVFKQENIQLTDLFKLKLLVKNRDIAIKLLDNKDITFPQSLIDFVENHHFYSHIVENKEFKKHEGDSVKVLSQELLKSVNYVNEFMTREPKTDYDKVYLNDFFSKTYNLIFDETNDKRNEFSFDIVKKKVQVAIDTIEYQKNYKSLSIQELREKNKDKPNPFAKIKK